MDKRLPRTAAEWRKKSTLLTAESIHDIEKYNSGSEIKREQFLLLRVLWKRVSQLNFAKPGSHLRWFSKVHYEEAQSMLQSELSH